MFHDVTGMMNGTAGVLSRKVCGFDREGGGVKRQTGLIPWPRPSTEASVTLCRKGAEVVAAVGAGSAHVRWISRR